MPKTSAIIVLMRLDFLSADIMHIDMGQEAAQDATDLRFLIAVRDVAHLEIALRNLRRTASVLRADRSKSSS